MVCKIGHTKDLENNEQSRFDLTLQYMSIQNNI